MSDFNKYFEARLVDNQLSEQDRKEIVATFSSLTKEEKDAFIKIYEKETGLQDPKKTIISELKSLREQVNTGGETYDSLKLEISSKNDAMGKLFNIATFYFNEKLKPLGLENNQNVKLVLWDKMLENINIGGGLNLFINKFKDKLSGLFSGFFEKKDTQNGDDLLNTINSIDSVFNDLFTNNTTADKTPALNYLDELMGDSFNKLKENKDRDLSSVEKVAEIFGKSNIKFEDIKKNTYEKVKFFEKTKGGLDSLLGMVSKLPGDFQNDIIGFFKDIAKEFPIIGFIFGLFFGEGFFEAKEIDKNGLLAITNLNKYFSNLSDSSEFKKLKIEEIKKLTPENFKEFFTYLKSKEIDYSKEEFWKQLFEGDKKNQKLDNLHNILFGEKNKMLGDKGDVNEFLKTLNGIEKKEASLESDKRAEKVRKLTESIEADKTKQAALASISVEGLKQTKTTTPPAKQDSKKSETHQTTNAGPTQDFETPKTGQQDSKVELVDKISKLREIQTIDFFKDDFKIDDYKEDKNIIDLRTSLIPYYNNKEYIAVFTKAITVGALFDSFDTIKEEINKIDQEKEKEKQKLDFEQSILSMKKLPADIIYNGEKKSLKLENNNIILGEDNYKISINATGIGESFKKIEFNNGAFIINGENENAIKDKQLLEVISSLLSKGNYVFSGVKSMPIVGNIDYKGTISKIA